METNADRFYHKYNVERTDGKPVGFCFVLEFKDPMAWPALETYAKTVEKHGATLIANDIRSLLREVKGE